MLGGQNLDTPDQVDRFVYTARNSIFAFCLGNNINYKQNKESDLSIFVLGG